MTLGLHILWLVPVLPLAAALAIALTNHADRRRASKLAIWAMLGSLATAIIAFAGTIGGGEEGPVREFINFPWIEMGNQVLELGWLLDPLTACMIVMVTFVSLLIFIYSTGYMAHDERYARFFCFLSLFAAAMLGLVISNSLLLLFICWELVGLASYLLIGFWYHKPEAVAAARKAFITTRVGDIGFLIGILWLYKETGTLLFYDHGHGCLEQSALAKLVAAGTLAGASFSTVIALLIFCGAMGKSGQVPLHVWLPDAMEGPTPVSALIHAATMVAAGVFLVARMFPLFDAGPGGEFGDGLSTALTVVTWMGAITALMASLIAVTQYDIKRILAYSTVSQLGFMMVGLGVGGVAVGMFHLLTHAFFKALLFLGAGSVIHGCHEEQDIRKMGGLWRHLPWTFVTYATGMLALSGFPLLAGFWSKDEIMHSALHWHPVGLGVLAYAPFALILVAAILTAFYMTRQMVYVFAGDYRGGHHDAHATSTTNPAAEAAPAALSMTARVRAQLHSCSRFWTGLKRELQPHAHPEISFPEVSGHEEGPHESPECMLIPLQVLAAFAVMLGVINTPFWPAFEGYLSGEAAHSHFEWGSTGVTWLVSIAAAGVGLWLGWRLFFDRVGKGTDPGEQAAGKLGLANFYASAQGRFGFDEAYAKYVGGTLARLAALCDWLDRVFWSSLAMLVAQFISGLSWVSKLFDEFVVNGSFDVICGKVRGVGELSTKVQDGKIQHYLRYVGLALVVGVLILGWGCGGA